jgi:hypothetical protein
MEDVKCQKCGTLFGRETDGVLTIKHRDLYRSVDGRVWGPCRGCGANVEWRQTIQDIPDDRPRPR